MELNNKIKNLTPYEPISGEYEYRFDANESYFNLDKKIIDLINENIAKIDFNRYPDPYATKLCEKFGEYYNIDSELVTAGNGSDELIGIIISSFLQKGDKVLTFTPDFVMYGFYSKLFENELIELKKDENLNIDFEQAKNLIDNDKTIKCVIFSNPCNPTSVGTTKNQIKKLLENKDCLIVLDEAYMDFWDQSFLNDIKEYENLIILKTLSKAFGMASIRIGFAVATKKLTNALRATKSPYNVNTVSQVIARTILEQKNQNKNKISDIILNCNKLYDKIKKLETKYCIFDRVYETKTNFVLIKTAYAKQIFDYLMSKSIIVRNFGDYLRITTGNQQQNEVLIEQLENILKEVSK